MQISINGEIFVSIIKIESFDRFPLSWFLFFYSQIAASIFIYNLHKNCSFIQKKKSGILFCRDSYYSIQNIWPWFKSMTLCQIWTQNTYREKLEFRIEAHGLRHTHTHILYSNVLKYLTTIQVMHHNCTFIEDFTVQILFSFIILKFYNSWLILFIYFSINEYLFETKSIFLQFGNLICMVANRNSVVKYIDFTYFFSLTSYFFCIIYAASSTAMISVRWLRFVCLRHLHFIVFYRLSILYEYFWFKSMKISISFRNRTIENKLVFEC